MGVGGHPLHPPKKRGWMIAEPVIKPIETSYQGCLFRSRLEARWAVFLTNIGAKWEYESQGYDISGTWYLPDFWIESMQMFMEIKSIHVTEEESLLCAQLSFVRPVLLVSGSPWPNEYKVSMFSKGDLLIKGMFAEYKDKNQLALAVATQNYGQGLMKLRKPVLARALSKARSARFEHGEKG